MCVQTPNEAGPSSQPCPAKQPAPGGVDDSFETIDSEVDTSSETTATAPQDADAIREEDDKLDEDDGARDQFRDVLQKDSIEVQKGRKVNDDEPHEANPRLRDYLIPHHRHVESTDEETHEEERCARVDTKEVEPQNEEHSTPAPQDRAKPESQAEATAKEESEASELQEQVKPEPAPQAEATAKVAEPQESKNLKRKVHFGTVLVRDYDMILGDHPCCSYGPPVMIDWNYLEYNAIDVNEYEFHHPPRRNLREMGMNYYQRKALLENAGYTEEDFKTIKKVVNKAKLNRHVTRTVVSHPLPLHKVEDAVESARRKFKRLVRTGSHRNLSQ